ncbi:MAG: tetratricopeptide repeat protein [Myxococcaceae bacterium]
MSSKKAIEHYERLVEEDPTNVRLLQKLGEVCQQAGDDIKAAAAFARVADCYERDGFFLKAVALLKQVLKLDPDRPGANFKLGVLHLKLQLLNEATIYFGYALSDAKRNGAELPWVEVSTRLVESNPKQPEFRLYFAHVLLWTGQKDLARNELVEAAKLLRPRDPDLASKAESLELSADTETTQAELEALNTIRRELDYRARIDADMRRLDFSQPN